MGYNKKEKRYEGWIYLISNNINNKKYIGQTSQTIKKRFGSHKSDARNGRDCALYRAMRKHGIDNFYVEEIECLYSASKDDLCKMLDEKEIYWIDYYNTYKGDGYNETFGGQIGFANNPDKFVPVDMYSLNGVLLEKFNSMSDAEYNTGVDKTAISRCCLGKSRTAKGVTFRFDGEPFDKFSVRDIRNFNVYQFDSNQNLVNIYDSLNDAELKTGFDRKNISAAIHQKRKHNGFYWNNQDKFPDIKYVNDNRIKIDKYSLLGDLLGTYDSMVDGAKSIGKGSDVVSTISDCCYGKTQYAFNYIWRIHSEPFDKYNTNIKISNYRPINCYNLQNKFIGSFQNLPLAQKALNLDAPISNSCLKSKTHISHNHKFYYIEDIDQPDKTKIKTLNEFLHEIYVLPILNQNPTN